MNWTTEAIQPIPPSTIDHLSLGKRIGAAREARLLGLDMPTKVAITDPDRGIPPEAIRLMMDRLDRANEETVDVTLEPAPLPPAIRGW
jgi:hypothetical protein